MEKERVRMVYWKPDESQSVDACVCMCALCVRVCVCMYWFEFIKVWLNSCWKMNLQHSQARLWLNLVWWGPVSVDGKKGHILASLC